MRAIRRPLWIIGFAVYISSNVFGSVFQIGALPIVVLAPLGGVSLLWNSLLAHFLLGEGFSNSMMAGTVLIATGAVLIAVFGVVPEEYHDLDDLLRLWAREPFVVFFTLVCLSVTITLVTAHVAAWRTRDRGVKLAIESDTTEPLLPLAPRSDPAEQPNGANGVAIAKPNHVHDPTQPQPQPKQKPKLKLKSVHFDTTSRSRTLIGLAFAAASGTLSGLCLVLAKAAVELVITTIEYWRTGRGSNEFTRPQTWFLVLGLAVAAVLQLVYLNYSLTFASPALVCPLAFCFYNLASIFDGLVFYDQLGRLSPHQIVLVTLGTAVLLVGVWAVSSAQPEGVELGTFADEWEEEALCDEPECTEHEELVRSPTGANYDAAPCPASPTHRRRSRYGTLREYQRAPAGFAFGIGAASPGFALRSNSLGSAGEGLQLRRARSQSAGQEGTVGLAGLGVRTNSPLSPRRSEEARGHSPFSLRSEVEAGCRGTGGGGGGAAEGQIGLGHPTNQPAPSRRRREPSQHADEVEPQVTGWSRWLPDFGGRIRL